MLKEWLPKHLEANDDLTLEEHREAFEEEFGEGVSTSTIGRAISRLPDGGWPLKKVARSFGGRGRGYGACGAGNSLRRQEASVRGGVGLQHLHVARLRARAPKGKRAYGRVPRNRAKKTTLIAAITLQGSIRASR